MMVSDLKKSYELPWNDPQVKTKVTIQRLLKSNFLKIGVFPDRSILAYLRSMIKSERPGRAPETFFVC